MDENCHVEPVYKDVPSGDQLQYAQQTILAVSGMGCSNCANRVHDKLISLEGVYDVEVYAELLSAQ